MITRLAVRSAALLCCLSLLSWLAPHSHAQAPNKSTAEKAAEKAQQKEAKLRQEALKKAAREQHKRIEEARKMLREEFKGKESEALKQAYVLMAAANHDYGGHRVKAMRQVEKAFDLLDANIMKQGTLKQRIKTLQDDNAAARAKILAGNSSAVHEAQAVADRQMFRAAAIMSVIGEASYFNKQPGVLDHVKKGLVELETALMIR